MLLLLLLPVILFITLLISLDSFKFIKIKTFAICSIWGIIAALSAFFINNFLIWKLELSFNSYSRYIAPFIEELLKTLIFIYVAKKGWVGFAIDGAIYGFATGAVFSLIENIFYFTQYDVINPMIWVVRGFGTAIMHGGATAIILMFAVGSLNTGRKLLPSLSLGALLAVLLHALYNHLIFMVSTTVTTVVIVITIPLAIGLVFLRIEKLIKNWLDLELYQEVQLLKMMRNGKFTDTKTGKYIKSLKNKFSPEMSVDMMNYLNLYTELSLYAKKLMLLREAGLTALKMENADEKLNELKALKKRIGKTGIYALNPVLRMNQKDVWKLNLLE